jgi:hypothetical protein
MEIVRMSRMLVTASLSYAVFKYVKDIQMALHRVRVVAAYPVDGSNNPNMNKGRNYRGNTSESKWS